MASGLPFVGSTFFSAQLLEELRRSFGLSISPTFGRGGMCVTETNDTAIVRVTAYCCRCTEKDAAMVPNLRNSERVAVDATEITWAPVEERGAVATSSAGAQRALLMDL